MSQHKREVAQGERFEFGANWADFLEHLDDKRISVAVESLKGMLETTTLQGKTFIDVGCGSGLFSLAARRLGAAVHSFDYDPRSVRCARELKSRYYPDDANWTVQEGSILDQSFLASLGAFDIVYSWGVLHHTGAMWKALENAAGLVQPQGQLFIAIYNDEGNASKRWLALKRRYNRGGKLLRSSIVAWGVAHFWWKPLVKDILRLKPGKSWADYKTDRGMSPVHDVIDWVGGYPFEVARPDQLFEFYRDRGFALKKLKTRLSLGCNEFVFVKCASETRRP